MKKILLLLAGFAVTTGLFAQAPLKLYKAGHVFDVSLPDYMNRTSGLNNAAAIQFKSTVKDVYGFIIFDTKDELQIVELTYSSTDEYYNDFVKDMFKEEKNVRMGTPQSTKKGDINFITCDVVYYSKSAKADIYYMVAVAETKTSYYKFVAWTGATNQDKVRTDLQNSLYSIHD